MKTNFFLGLMILSLFISCKKTDDRKIIKILPVLTTNVVNVSITTATLGGNITDAGTPAYTERGICYATTEKPTTANNKHVVVGSGTGNFSVIVTGLTENTTYYVRAYAVNSDGTVYGEQVSFKTNAFVLPSLVTNAAADITTSSATVGGNIANAGVPAYTERGVCYGTAENPTTADNKDIVAGSGTGNFSVIVTGLTENKIYYVRAYAVNSAGTVYGEQVSFKTNPFVPPVLTTEAVSNISFRTATFGGNITNAGTPAYTERGVCYSTSPNPTIGNNKKTVAGNGMGVFNIGVTGLTENTVYYVRAYATNSTGTVYGEQVSFKTEILDFHLNGDVNRLSYVGENAVNLVILGDGFVTEDLKKDGYFDSKAKELVEYLFTVAPFKQYRKYFNVYIVYAVSANRGAAQGNMVPGRTTFGSYFYGPTDRLLVTGSYDSCMVYARKAVPANKEHIVLLVVNEDQYGGSGGSVAVASTNKYSKYVAVHEIGHSFAALGDEYIEEAVANNYPLSRLPYMANIDDKNDLNTVKWKHFFKYPVYNGKISAFNGAYYRENLYRPEQTSLMRDLNTISFNGPSREAIVKKICATVGVPYDQEAFFAEDAVNVNPISIQMSAKWNPPPLINDFIITPVFLQKHQSIMQKLKVK
ncbi:M64 family metallopeptidase [Niabella hirudinis]|uniref:M64 family metallopeptidase n=1 Tax=Niabella hirudinis TaxID=1285929 RepID=UPI003EBD61E4